MRKTGPIRDIMTLLGKKNTRLKAQKFVIEGPHLIEEALADIDYIVYTKKYPVMIKAAEMGIPCYKVSERDYNKVSQVVTPQGIMAVVKRSSPSIDTIAAQERSLILVCVDIQDPGNLGTIIRLADAAGISGIIVTKGCVDVYNQKTIRSTAGSLFHVPVVRTDNVIETLAGLKQKNFRVIAADPAGIENFWETDLVESAAVLIGNEGAGLSKEMIGLSDAVVKVPILGRAESLNAAICASVILYEAIRQRQNG